MGMLAIVTHIRGVLVLLSLVHVSVSFTSGNTKCPCISLNYTKNTTEVAVVNGGAYDYPSEYGMTGCSTHDRGLEPNCGDNSNDYCTEA